MSIINPPSWLQAGTYNARADRLGVGSLLSVPGVASATSYLVSQTLTPSMTVQISAGSAYVKNTFGIAQGYYTVVNDGTVTIALDASHPNYGRIDTIILRVYDAQYSGSDNLAQIEKITGAAAPSPSIGAIPDNSIILATVFVGAQASSVTNTNIGTVQRQVARFNSTLVNTVEPLSSTTNPGSAYIGQMILEQDTGKVKMYTSTGWSIISPTTAYEVPNSAARPTGINAWRGRIIVEADTKRFYSYDGAKWNYLSGGNGETITTTFTAWNPNYQTVYGTGASAYQPLTLWRDAEGRYNLEGWVTNAVPISSWGIYAQYGICYLPAGTYPQYDQRVISTVIAPNLGNEVTNIIIKGQQPNSETGGSPGIIIWQPAGSKTWSVPVGRLLIGVTRMSWPSQ